MEVGMKMKSGGPQGSPEGEFAEDLEPTSLTDREREILRQVAQDSILHGLREGSALRIPLENYPDSLRREGAVFVTLQQDGQLRGCIGSLRARRPLVEDVAENAFAAAFRDHRFAPVSEDEADSLELHISLLTPPESFPVKSREELLAALDPGRDGLLLEDPPHRSTFLPQVWEALPDPEDFLGELLLKAGLPRDHWSETLTFQRYAVEEF
jgi:AmmeMemoRadiSam system protein A